MYIQWVSNISVLPQNTLEIHFWMEMYKATEPENVYRQQNKYELVVVSALGKR